MPYERENPHPPTSDKDAERVALLESEADYRELTSDERDFITKIRDRNKLYRGFDPYFRLRNFYRKNHFEIDGSGHFISRPPHRLFE